MASNQWLRCNALADKVIVDVTICSAISGQSVLGFLVVCTPAFVCHRSVILDSSVSCVLALRNFPLASIMVSQVLEDTSGR